MTEKRCLSILAAACLVLAGLCLLAFWDGASRSPETFDTALLNGGSVSALAEVEIAGSDGTIFLRKADFGSRHLWLGDATVGLSEMDDGAADSADSSPDDDILQRLVFPVDAVTMEEFLSVMAAVRPLTRISDKVDEATLSSFGLDSDHARSVEFILSDGSTASRILFGERNFSGYRLYLKTPDSPVYQARDDFYPWLTVSAKSWADMALVPRQPLGIGGEGEVQGLSLALAEPDGSFVRTVLPKDGEFASKAGKLLSLRGGSLVLPAQAAGLPLVGEITLDTGFGDRLVLKIHRKPAASIETGEVSSYYVLPEFDFYSATADQGASALSYGFEISGWTWNSIRELFG